MSCSVAVGEGDEYINIYRGSTFIASNCIHRCCTRQLPAQGAGSTSKCRSFTFAWIAYACAQVRVCAWPASNAGCMCPDCSYRGIATCNPTCARTGTSSHQRVECASVPLSLKREQAKQPVPTHVLQHVRRNLAPFVRASVEPRVRAL